MAQKQLPQIKIFKVDDYETALDLEISINSYILECFNKDGWYPSQIDTNSKFITVISNKLVKIEKD